MMKICAFVLLVHVFAFAQSPQDLFSKTAEHYQSLDSYEISGTMTTKFDVPAGPTAKTPTAQWIFESPQLTAAASAKYVPKGSPWPALPEVSMVMGGRYTNATPATQSTLDKQFGIGVPVVAQYDQLNLNVASVTRIGSENIKVGDESVPCENS